MDAALRRVAVATWAALGVLALVYVASVLVARFESVVVPLVLGLFPTIVLAPLHRWLRQLGLPPALAAFLAVLSLLAALSAGGVAIGRAVNSQLAALGPEIEQGYEQVRLWLAEDSPVRAELGPPEELWDRLRSWANDGDGLGVQAASVVNSTTRMLAGGVLMLVTTFFYLKDGRRLVAWLPDALPQPWARRVDEAASAAWANLVAYFRGQLLVAMVDAVAIGVGLALLGVPLALSLAVLVFFGGFFPIVGATLSGLVAALVALADGGVGLALAVVALVIAVQQLEGNLLEPLIVGRATRLHPLVVILALAAGSAEAGLLGAFLGVPVAAVVAAVVRYARAERRLSAPPTGQSPAG